MLYLKTIAVYKHLFLVYLSFYMFAFKKWREWLEIGKGCTIIF